MKPYPGGAEGRRRDRLHDRVDLGLAGRRADPALLMSGIIGRLFREFAVTLAMTIFVSAFVSLTLTPMMASRFLKSARRGQHGRLYKLSERGFEALANGYERGLDFVLAPPFPDAADLPRDGRRDRSISSSSSPRDSSRSRTPASSSAPRKRGRIFRSPRWSKLQEQLGAIVQADPAVATIAMALGAGVGNAAQNNGRMFVTLKPREERDVDAFQVIARLRPKLAEVKGAQALSAGRAGRHRRRARRRARSSSTRSRTPISTSSTPGRRSILDKLKSLPELRDVASDQQVGGTTLTITIDRDMASRFGIQPQLIDDTLYDAFGQRQVDAVFHPGQHLRGDRGDPARAAGRSGDAGQDLHPLADDRADGAAERLRQMDDQPGRAAVDQPPGPVPGDHHQLQPRPRRRARPGDARRSRRRQRDCNCRGGHDDLPGQRAGVPGFAGDRAAADPGGAGRGLSHPRRALRELHPPADDSLHPALGRSSARSRC